MVKDDAMFPRGVDKQEVAARKNLTGKRSNSLFGGSAGETKVKRVRRYKSKNSQWLQNENKEMELIDRENVSRLGAVREGLISLAAVHSIHETEICVRLPKNVPATVSIADVSSSFNTILSSLVGSGEGEDEGGDVPGLSHMFSVGQIVCVRVMQVDDNQIRASMDPININCYLPFLCVKMPLWCSVVSLEDKGFMMDVGIRGKRGFLSHSAAKYFNGELNVGNCLWCVSSSTHLLASAADDEESGNVIRLKLLTKSQTTLNEKFDLNLFSKKALLPIQRVSAAVSVIGDAGLAVDVEGVAGSIHKSHLLRHLKQYNVGDRLEVVVLSTNIGTNSIAFSELTIFDNVTASGLSATAIGDIIENLRILYVERSRGICVVSKQHRGYVRLPDFVDEKIKLVPSEYRESGAVVKRSRVIGYNCIDGVLLLSCKPSIFSRRLIAMDDVKPGDVFLKAPVVDLVNSGRLIQLDANIVALLPKLFDNQAKSSKKINVVVLSIDLEKSRILVCSNSDLIKSERPRLTSLEQLSCDKWLETDGIVSKVQSNGIYMTFFNNLFAFCPLNVLGDAVATNIESAYPVGRFLTVKTKLHNNKIRVSMLKLPSSDSHLEIGTQYDCVVESVDKSGIFLRTKRSDRAFLPTDHLSDFTDLTHLWLEALTEGDSIRVVCVSNDAKGARVSMKESYLTASTHLLSSSDLVVGECHPCTVRNIAKFGVFVDTWASIRALIPFRLLTSRRVPDISMCLPLGSTLICRVTEIEGDRCVFSALLKDIGADLDSSLLLKYLEERGKLMKNTRICATHKSQLSFQIGEVIEADVVEKSQKQIKCCDSVNKCDVFVRRAQFFNRDVDVGDHVMLAVIDICFKDNLIEASFNPKLLRKSEGDSKLKSRKVRRIKKEASEIKIGDVAKSEMVFIGSSHALVALHDRSGGHIAYLPSRRHLNDLLEPFQYIISQTNEVVIKNLNTFVPNPVVTLLAYESFGSSTAGSDSGGIKVGDKFTDCVVDSKTPIQMKIRIRENVVGTVHVTEMVEQLDILEPSPLKSVKVGDKISVQIAHISREIRRGRTAKPQFHCTMLSCSHLARHQKLDHHEEIVGVVKNMVFPNVFVSVNCLHSYPINYLNFSASSEEYERLTKLYPCGQLVKVKVDISRGGKLIRFYRTDDLAVSPAIGLRNVPVLVKGVTSHGVQIIFGNNNVGFISWLKYSYPLLPLIDEPPPLHSSLIVDVVESTGSHYICQISDISPPTTATTIQPEAGRVVPGYVKSVHSNGLFVAIGEDDLVGFVSLNHICSHFISNATKCGIRPMQLVHCKILSFDKENKKIRLSLLSGDTGFDLANNLVRKQRPQQQVAELQNADELAEKPVKAITADLQFNVDEIDIIPHRGEAMIDEEDVNMASVSDGECSISLEQENCTDRVELLEKRVMKEPNDSAAWIEYVSHFAERHDVTLARATCERALAAISPTAETDKFNIWMSYLNLELMFGDDEKFEGLLKKAQQSLDQLKLFTALIDVYSSHNKHDMLDELFQLLIRKHGSEEFVWKKYLQYLFERNDIEKARRILNRSLDILPVKAHIAVILAAARLEFDAGNLERGETLFERILSSSPKRIDIWNVFIDLLVKHDKIDAARIELNRAISIDFSFKKMQSLFKRFLAFEEEHGSSANVQDVRQKAEEYLKRIDHTN